MSKIPPAAQRVESEEGKYSVEKDPYVGKNIVWENHKNYHVDVKHGTKRECEAWVKKKIKKKKKNKRKVNKNGSR